MPFIATNYPENWKDEIRPRILKRDGYRCRICLVGQRWYGYRDNKGNFVRTESREPVFGMSTDSKIIRIWLSVAHLDHDTWNNEDSNLKSMCQQCHNRHDRHHRSANRIGRGKPKKNSILSNNSLRSNTAPSHRNTRKLKHTWLPPSNPPPATLTPCKRALPLAPNPAFPHPPFGRVKVLIAPLRASVIAYLGSLGRWSAALRFFKVVLCPAILGLQWPRVAGHPISSHRLRAPGRNPGSFFRSSILLYTRKYPSRPCFPALLRRGKHFALASGRVVEKVFLILPSYAMGRVSKRPDGIGVFPALLGWCASPFTCRSRSRPCGAVTSSRRFDGVIRVMSIYCPFTSPAPLFGQSRVFLVI